MKLWKVAAFVAMEFTLFVLLAGCVSTSHYKRDMRRVYKDAFKMGKMIGRHEVLDTLKSPDCFIQKVDELMLADPKETAIPGTLGAQK